MERTITERQAREQYQLLLEGYMDDNSLQDKASNIRSRIDTVLRIAYAAVFPENPQALDSIPQAALIDALLSGKRHETLRRRMDMARETLNKKAMHRYRLELAESPERNMLTEDEYKNCLSAVCDFIAQASGVPIPPPLLHARETLSMKVIEDYSRIEVIFLVQLYNDISQAAEGSFILSQLRKMIQERDRIGLNSLSVKVVTYAPPMTLTDFPAAGGDSTASAPSGYARALNTALDLVESAVSRREDLGGDKPWLMWLTHGFSDQPDNETVSRLQDLMDKKVMGFYPIALTPEAGRQFTDLWPECGPKCMEPSLAGNLFNNSVLLTIQMMHEE